jgi:polysaccharide pyruvyl transferase WcaK-like protein
MRLPFVTLLDPSIGSRNLGDKIISEAVHREIRRAAPSAWLQVYSSHQALGLRVASSIRRCRVGLVGGSNLLDFSMGWTSTFNQWGVGVGSVVLLRGARVVLVGVGSTNYSPRGPSRAAKQLLPRLLSQTQLHSVRDTYTAELLHALGISNALYTGCPTMWNLDPDLLGRIPATPATEAVVVVTDYRRAPELDTGWLRLVKQRYEKVHLWPQGEGDLGYVTSLGLSGLNILPPTLEGYDDVLAGEDRSIDYVGTRLHAGIRALQFGRRAVIISVDNRSREISRSTGPPVVGGEPGTGEIARALDSRDFAGVSLPRENIDRWRRWLADSLSAHEPG